MPINLICEICGKPFSVKLSHTKKRYTCSRECGGKRHSKLMKGHEYWGGHQYQKGHPPYGGFETRFNKGIKPWNTGLNCSGMSGKITSEETKRKIAEANNKPEYIIKRQKALHKKPTGPERRVIEMIKEYNLPFLYVGDGEKIIGSFIPDFIHKTDKKVIEVFGRQFHDPTISHLDVSWNRQYWGRQAIYNQLGYDCLILWDDELNSESEVLNKINNFRGRLI